MINKYNLDNSFEDIIRSFDVVINTDIEKIEIHDNSNSCCIGIDEFNMINSLLSNKCKNINFDHIKCKKITT